MQIYDRCTGRPRLLTGRVIVALLSVVLSACGGQIPQSEESTDTDSNESLGFETIVSAAEPEDSVEQVDEENQNLNGIDSNQSPDIEAVLAAAIPDESVGQVVDENQDSAATDPEQSSDTEASAETSDPEEPLEQIDVLDENPINLDLNIALIPERTEPEEEDLIQEALVDELAEESTEEPVAEPEEIIEVVTDAAEPDESTDPVDQQDQASIIESEPDEPALSTRPLDGHCLAGSAPGDTIVIERLLSNYKLNMPTDAEQIPDASEPSIFILEKRGRVLFTPLRLEVDHAEIQLVLELPVDDEGDGGLLGLALHPDYVNNRRVYITYSLKDEDENRTLYLSEFTTGENHKEWGNEKVILSYDQQSDLHYGGSLRFAPDGKLFMGFGDDGSYIPNDVRRWEAQDPRTMVGTIIRIDVDNPQEGMNYSIPADNPSINGLEINEVYAYGFRNPWRMSFDSEWPHELYIGDVGQHAFEEINLVVAGGNYGWPECEGLCESSKTGFVDPLHAYERTSGRAVIGGVVYRGQKMPSLRNKYVYADYVTRSIHALDIQTPSSNGSYPVETVASTELVPSGFFLDEDQEMYVFGRGSNGLYRLLENFDNSQSEPPNKISDTGCFAAIVDGYPEPKEGVQDYQINQQFWSDGAKKQRLLSLPENTEIDSSDPYNWQLPPGGVIIKHYNNGDFGGYTYYWDDDLNEAQLVNSEGASRQIGDQTWNYPSRAQCVLCHTEAAGGTLALESAQLNLDHALSPTVDGNPDSAASDPQIVNQIDFLINEGYVSSDTGSRIAAYPTLEELENTDLPIDERVLSYLHVNCSSCHRGERSVGRANWDARYITAHGDKELCNVAPLVGVHSFIEQLIWPALWQRANIRGSSFDMPPVGSQLVDPLARTLLAEWIDGLNANCVTAD